MNDTTGSLGDALGGAATPITIPTPGKTYTVIRPRLAEVEAVEAMIGVRVTRGVDRLKGEYTPEEYAEEKAAARAFVSARKHQMGGPVFNEVIGSVDGLGMILLACLRVHHPEMTEADVRKLFRTAPEACKDALALVTPDFFTSVAQERGLDPARTAELVERFRTSLTTSTPTPTRSESTP